MSFDFLKSKPVILTVVAVSIVLGIIFSFSGHAFIKMTSGEKFCTSCHTWMNPMGEAYAHDVHGGNNKRGIKATCVSCHLPHDSLANYLFTKGVNGIKEVTTAIVGDAKEMDWLAHRENRESFVYDSGCKSCHADIEKTEKQSRAASRMHTLYTKYKDADKDPLKCASCHVNVGHKKLSKILYDRTHEPIGEWESDKK